MSNEPSFEAMIGLPIHPPGISYHQKSQPESVQFSFVLLLVCPLLQFDQYHPSSYLHVKLHGLSIADLTSSIAHLLYSD